MMRLIEPHFIETPMVMVMGLMLVLKRLVRYRRVLLRSLAIVMMPKKLPIQVRQKRVMDSTMIAMVPLTLMLLMVQIIMQI